MSIVPARLATYRQPTGLDVGEIPQAANDNDYLYLVDTEVYCTRGAPSKHSRSPAFIRLTGGGELTTHKYLNQLGDPTLQRTRRGELISSYYLDNNTLYRRDTPEARYYHYSLGSGLKYFSKIYPYLNGAYDAAYSVENNRYVSSGFDPLGRPTIETTREGYGSAAVSAHAPNTRIMGYDDGGNIEKVRYWSGAYTNYTYNKNGLMTGARFSQTASNATEREVAGYSYDLLGRRVSTTLGDSNRVHGADSPNPGNPAYAKLTYSYDANSDLKRIMPQWSRPDLDRTSLVGFHYNYDYDGAGLMTAAHSTSASWRYAPSDNVQDYAGTNKLDQYGSVDMGDGAGPQDQVHDAAGNLTSSGAGRTYTYNSENQLIRAQGPGLHMEYWYDSEGRRDRSLDHVANTEVFHQHLGQMHPKGTSSLALGAEVGDYSVCRTALVSGACPATNTIGQGKVIAYTPLFRIILGQNIDERIAYHDVDGDDLSFYLTNHQGSTISMTTETGTQKLYADGGRYVYTPYGGDAHKGTASEVSMSGNPFRYTGRRLDAQTGLYYYRARYYDSEGGRFLQTDPIGTDDQMNLYAYVGNNPLNGTDPTGMAGTDCVDGSICGTKSDAEFDKGYAALVKDFETTVIADKFPGQSLGDLQKSEGYHAYTNLGFICSDCTIQDVQGEYARQPAPLWDSKRRESEIQSGDKSSGLAAAPRGAHGVRVPLPGGTVRHNVDESTGAIANITTKFHTLDPGYVIRRPVQMGNSVYSLTLGRGVGRTPELNEYYGPRLFNDLDKLISSRVNAR